MKSTISTLAALLLVLFLNACGQSGPLFVPGNPSSIQTLPGTSVEETQKNEDEDEDTDSQ